MRDNQFEYASAMERLSYTAEQKAELARRSGISEVYLHQVFAGRRNPSRDRLLCICVGLGITLDETQRMLTQGGLRPTVSPHQTGRHYQLWRGPSAAPGGGQ